MFIHTQNVQLQYAQTEKCLLEDVVPLDCTNSYIL